LTSVNSRAAWKKGIFSASLSLCVSNKSNQINVSKLTACEKYKRKKIMMNLGKRMTKKRESYVANLVRRRDASRGKVDIYQPFSLSLPSLCVYRANDLFSSLVHSYLRYHPPSYSLRHALSRFNPRTTLNDATSWTIEQRPRRLQTDEIISPLISTQTLRC